MESMTPEDGRAAGEAEATTGESGTPAPPPVVWFLRPGLVGPLVLAAVTLVLFGDVLFSTKALVLSKYGTDLSELFLYLREFGFGELRRGHLPLWNPYLFAGAPYLGTFQSALLYPPNVLYLLLPLPRAINWDIALHVFLAGLFTYYWALRRGLQPGACLLSAAVVMLGGPFYLHLYAGHLTVLASMAWAPLILLAIDGLSEPRPLRWGLLGTLAAALQLLAGYPQTFFYTAVAAVLYLGVRVAAREAPAQALLGLVGIYIGAAALGAAQLLPGLELGAESTRGAGVPYSFAALFSFPPENLLTLIAPGFFGDLREAGVSYWGRCYLWEMSLFCGVGACALAAHGVAQRNRSGRWLALVWVALLLLALGGHTPLLRLLHAWVPGFDRFRGPSKFILPASLMLALMSGTGMDRLLREPGSGRRMALFLLSLGVAAGAAAAWVYLSAGGGLGSDWGRLMQAVAATGESYLPRAAYKDPDFVRRAGEAAAQGLLVCAAVSLLLAAFFRVGDRPGRVFLIGIVAVLELGRFAATLRPTFDFADTRAPLIRRFLAEHPGDYRILQVLHPTSALSTRAQNLAGYEPSSILERYARFIAFTQGQPEVETAGPTISRIHPLFRLLRCRYAFVHRGGQVGVMEIPDSLARVQLVYDWQLLRERDAIFTAMASRGFDPRRTVILESRPDPLPVLGAPGGWARAAVLSTDALEIEAEAPRPALLLVGDSYSRGWRAVPLPGSSQAGYEVMPADWVIRAIPLAAGRHRLRLEYAPAGFRIGKWVSLVSLVLFAGLCCFALIPGSLTRLREGGAPGCSRSASSEG
jgi:xanthosine utilization system XapX-like protein